jgi:hypothetical protein
MSARQRLLLVLLVIAGGAAARSYGAVGAPHRHGGRHRVRAGSLPIQVLSNRAGESIASDIQRCTLEHLRQSDYYPIAFTPQEFRRSSRSSRPA